MKWLLILVVFASLNVTAQCKNYKVTSKGDTINCVDQKDLRQGKWVVKMPPLRGEPGYEEEGIYKDGKKEGIWRAYTEMGDLFAIESYRWGNKDGKSQYFNIAGLQREESWKAVNPENPYDTVDVYDPYDPFKVEKKIVKIEGSSVKHGMWKWYESGSGSITRTENYFLGKLQEPQKKKEAEEVMVDNGEAKPAPAKKPKPKEVMEFEKKKRRVADGSTGL